MPMISRKDYITLLAVDAVLFAVSLWVTLAIRNLAFPGADVFLLHLRPFSLLFAVWIIVFLFAGLYERYTRFTRGELPVVIFYAQAVNIGIAVLFFFLVPSFGIAPKTILAIYLVVSSVFIYLWRVYAFPYVRRGPQSGALLVGRADVMEEIAVEIEKNPQHALSVAGVIDTKGRDMAEVIQGLCRATDGDEVSVVVVDTSDQSMSAVLPILYDRAFRKEKFALADAFSAYEDIFDRSPLKLMRYELILGHVSRASIYDRAKRLIDAISGAIGVIFTFLVVYPLVAFAIKLEDGGEVMIKTERVGQYQRPIKLIKFRSMNGNDEGKYVKGKTSLKVTKTGWIIRKFHIDEFPQFWNLLKGEISLVGPRPEMPALAAEYAARIPYYNARHLIKPGLTGWARIRHKGDPHHGADVHETKTKLSYDLYYLRHRSFLLDVHIVVQTVKFLLTASGRGTEALFRKRSA